MSESQSLDIRGSLEGERIFITGATGFVGKVLTEKLLWSVPGVGKLLLLVRPDAGRSAAQRVRDELLDSPIMARLRALHADNWESFAAEKIEAVAGDLAQDRFGLTAESYAALTGGVDRVVASAATVTFDERLDRALELNTRGALRTLALARDAGAALLHISTCFVSGQRGGSVTERVAPPELAAGLDPDPEAMLARLDEAYERALRKPGSATSRSARDGAHRANQPASPSGGRTGAAAAALVAAGAEVAARYGFNDVYTLTKALGEGLIERERGAVPVAILRPAIVESAAVEPIPGWIEAVRVTDPLLVAYGRGRTRDFAGAAGAPLDLVPVDYVVNAMIAALAELPRSTRGTRASMTAAKDSPTALLPVENGLRVYQVGSARNPISLEELLEYAREGFSRTPLLDEQGQPIDLPEARFVEPERYRRKLTAKRARLRRLERWLGATSLGRRLTTAGRTLDHFVRLLEVYRPYLDHPARYADAATRDLWARLPPADRGIFPFDVAGLDWRAYIAEVHVPGLRRFALHADSGAPAPRRRHDPVAEEHARGEFPAAQATNLFELFETAAMADPDTVAFQTCRDGRWLRYTYGQALTATANLAMRMSSRYGIEPGDRVVLWGGASPEWTLTSFAVHRLGAVTVPLDPQWPAGEAEQAVRFTGAKLICAAPALAAGLAGATAPRSGLGTGLGYSSATPSDGGHAHERPPVVALAAPFVPEPDVPPLPGTELQATARVASEQIASILFTSGTTVAPKAVPLTHGNLLANVRDLVPVMRSSRQRLLSVLPIHHVFEFTVGLLVPLVGGGTISYVAELKPAEISWMMGATKPTMLVAVPRLLELLHNGIRQSVAAGGPALGALFRVLFALSALTGARHGHRLFGKVHRRFGGALRRIATGGSALEASLGRSFQLMGFEVAEGYGMTETSPVLTVNPWGATRFGSVGRPLDGVEVEVRSAGGTTNGTAARAGEIWVRGASVMAGYYRNPEATREAMRDGWLNTGDVGFFDADGYLEISGRTKDIIVTAAGKNVYPEEVEQRYRGLAGVEELVVVGLPGKSGGESVSAVVVPRPDATAEEVEAIHAAIAARSTGVPSYQQISRIEIWQGDLPKTTTLKVKRSRLREALLDGKRGAGSAPAKTAASAPRPAAAASEQAAPAAELGERETWVLATLARLTRTRRDVLRASDRLAELGVDSLTRVEFVAELESRFGLRVDDEATASLSRVQDLFDLVASSDRHEPVAPEERVASLGQPAAP